MTLGGLLSALHPPPIDEYADRPNFDVVLGYGFDAELEPARAGGQWTGMVVDSCEPSPPCGRCGDTGVTEGDFSYNGKKVRLWRPCQFCGSLGRRSDIPLSPYELARGRNYWRW